jgi:ornithine carbamoyltransferase
MTRHLLTLDSLGRDGIRNVLDLAVRMKKVHGDARGVLDGGLVGLIFDKPSIRTRVSFTDAAWGLGMLPMEMRGDDVGIGTRESVPDSARVLSRYLTALMIRTFEHSKVEGLAEHATIPVINGLTDDHHPCQALADVMTIEEEFGSLAGLRVAYVGDGNNVCHSLMQAAAYLGFTLAVSTPEGYRPNPAITAATEATARQYGGAIEIGSDPAAAVRGADAVYTDVWASMGQEKEAQERARVFAGYQVDSALMKLAAPRAIFLHCLPAHRGSEVTDEVMDGRQSRVFDEAENRWYTAEALLYILVTGDDRGERLRLGAGAAGRSGAGARG